MTKDLKCQSNHLCKQKSSLHKHLDGNVQQFVHPNSCLSISKVYHTVFLVDCTRGILTLKYVLTCIVPIMHFTHEA